MKFFFVTLLSVASTLSVFAQKTDSLKTERVNFLSRQLAVPTKTAAKVEVIMDAYKNEAKTILSKNPDEKTLRVKVDSLITVKNKKLSAILTKEQLAKIVPANEQPKPIK